MRDNPNSGLISWTRWSRDVAPSLTRTHLMQLPGKSPNAYGYHDLNAGNAASMDVILQRSCQGASVMAHPCLNGPFWLDSALAKLITECASATGESSFGVSIFHTLQRAFLINRVVFFARAGISSRSYSPNKPLGFLRSSNCAERFTSIMTEQANWQAIGLGEPRQCLSGRCRRALDNRPERCSITPRRPWRPLAHDAAGSQATSNPCKGYKNNLNGRIVLKHSISMHAIAGAARIGISNGCWVIPGADELATFPVGWTSLLR